MKFGILLSLFFVFLSSAWGISADTAVGLAADKNQVAEISNEVSDMVAAENAKSDDEIPVHFSKTKKSEATESSNSRFFLTFGLMALFLGVGYYFAKKYGRPKNSTQTKIKILTQHYLGPKKSLAIVRVAGESILIGVTDQNINMIKSLSLLDDEVPDSISNASFQETFNEKKEMTVTKASSNSISPMNIRHSESSDDRNREGGEEFSIRHIKDVVTLKLKSMRGDI